ncbi:MAG TPA: CvpA family protein [Hyphomicrobiaceae bacterium]|nr:CvpA family protein [Hyphomicrobiaceae bacterium]
MIFGQFTYLDAALVGVALLSGLLAMNRGLSRELLSILSWILGPLAGLYVWFHQASLAADMAPQVGMPPVVGQAGLAAIVGLIVLVVLHLITMHISDSIQDSRVGLIDRVLGFLFGIGRGFVLILILFMGYQKFVPEKDQHVIVTKAQSRPMLESSGRSLETTLTWFYDRLLNRGSGDQQPQQQG